MSITVGECEEFLNNVRKGEKDIARLEIRLRQLRDLAFPGSLRPRDVMVQESAPSSSRISNILAAESALSEEIARQMKRQKTHRQIVRDVISEIDSKTHRELLTLYYLYTDTVRGAAGANHKPILFDIYNLTWSDVAYQMHKKPQDIYAIRTAAIRAFRDTAEDMGIKRLPGVQKRTQDSQNDSKSTGNV